MDESTYLNSASMEEMESLLELALNSNSEDDDNYFEEVDRAENY